MKIQYIGDVKDYGKMRFLKLICDTTGLRLGINWYLTANDSSTQGNFGRIPQCRDGLYSVVSQLKKPGAAMADYGRSGILPDNTVYYDSLLAYTAQPTNKARRYAWHQAAMTALNDCGIIFLDPDTGVIANEFHDDNGIAGDNFFRLNEQRDGTRYVSLTEIKNHLANGKSLVLFQYGVRVGGIDAQLQTVYKKLKRFVGDPTVSYVYRYSKTVNDEIAFICYAQPAHLRHMARFDAALLDPQAPWGEYFTRWVEPSTNNQAGQAKRVKSTPASPSMPSSEPATLTIRKNASPQEKLCTLLALIPKGRVTTYGWLATQIYGNPGAAQGVVSMLKAIAHTSAPCHRVVSNDGQPKALDVNYGNTGKTHKQLLQSEGVIFLGHATIDMGECMCKPRLAK